MTEAKDDSCLKSQGANTLLSQSCKGSVGLTARGLERYGLKDQSQPLVRLSLKELRMDFLAMKKGRSLGSEMRTQTCDRRDNQKKRFLETLAEQGTVSCAAQVAGVSRMTAYRWRQDDREFAALWDDAMETAVDAVESALYQKARSGDTVPMIFYLKAHRPIYRDRVTINVAEVQNEVEERLAQLQQRQPSSSTAELIKEVLLPES